MAIHNGPVVATRDALKVIDCYSCGFYHLEDLPSPVTLAEYYASDFWQHKKIGTRERMDEQREWWAAIYGDWLTLARKHIGTVGPCLLDVGAGYGHMLDEAERAGFASRGIEPSTDVPQNARLWQGTWERWESMERFECVSALWLIEHLPNPLRFLRWVRGRLDVNGVLLAVVPSDFNMEQDEACGQGKALENYWIDPTHLNYFTWSSFSNLLGRAGFRIVERSTLYPMELFLKQGHDYTRDAGVGAMCHAAVRQTDLSKDRAQRLKEYQELAAVGLGREIVVVAVKEG